MRRLYAPPEVIEWMRTVLISAKTDGFTMGAASPKEQVAVLCHRFVAGHEFDWPVPHPMRPEEAGIYRFRTDDVRLNGWFPEKCCFVIGSAGLKAGHSTMGDDELRDQAITVRERLQVNGGAYLTGDYNDHI